MPNKSHAKPHRVIRSEPLILVVEDDRDNLFYTSCILDLSNYQFLKADNGKDGLDIAMDRLPDLILLDIVMPKVSGIEAIEILRRNPITNHIHVLAVTGLVFPHQIKMIMDAGCDDYLTKPFTIEQLEAKLDLFLKSRV